ncbi:MULTISPECIES: AAA family ATPase [Mesotoga]|uniref:DNA repair protein RecN n=1 Tax=Mesotoga TaxID=1184396 RepID=UPI0002CCD742|nr:MULTISPECIES: AAA family ATPase [Mesotoga]CCU86056.1 SMC domain protein [Mesotoga infera]HOP37101.1 AAA family ATPase [Mesotoga prima]HOZ98961.1 AAA family ATPase [Mesotoga prima]HPE52762.1 AAA family ATPase [Mesotoga prima]HPJ31575.1 AAA family ATPase [Mesotoga prima]
MKATFLLLMEGDMLLSLAGKDFLTFKDFYVEFSGGMNAITGESGAGKTVFLKALWAVLGFPPLWDNDGSGSVEGNFAVDDSLLSKLGDMGVDINGDQLLVSVSFTGQRTIYRINGKMVPKQIVQSAFRDRVEIHSQHSSISLLDESKHHIILDHALGGDTSLTRYSELYAEYIKVRRELDSFIVDPSQIEREKDFLEFQIREIEQADLQPHEDEVIEMKYTRYRNAQMLLETFQELTDLLKDGELSIYNSLNDARATVEKIRNFGYKDWLDNLQIALEELDSLYTKIEEERSTLEIDDEEFSAIESRITIIQGLKRKYGDSVEKILVRLEEFKKELGTLKELEGRKERLKKNEEELLSSLKETGRIVDQKRLVRAKEIEEQIRVHLEDLRMKGAELRFHLKPELMPRSYGTSKVTMVVKTNPGMDLMEIGSVASGGELSRFLLALESALKNQLDLKTIVFDEVDSGVGQRLGTVVSGKLEEISREIQTIVITHLPQIAMSSDRHFVVRKQQVHNETISIIEELHGSSKEREIEEMSGQIPD